MATKFDLENLFFVDSAIGVQHIEGQKYSADESFFVGRNATVEKLCRQLAKPKSSALIYGERGSGKTSLAWMCLSVLTDKSKKFGDLKLTDDKYRVIYFKCSGEPTLDSAIINLLVARDEYSLRSTYADIFPKRTDTVTRKITAEIKAKNPFFDAGLTVEGEPTLNKLKQLEAEAENRGGPVTVLQQYLSQIKKKYPEEKLVIILDEIDTISNFKSSDSHTEDRVPIVGLGSLIKNLNNAQMIICGIADNIDELLIDHASVERKLDEGIIDVPNFTELEITELFENIMKKSNGRLRFSEDAIREIAKASYGLPWITQALGKRCVRNSKSTQTNINQDAYFIDESIAIQSIIEYVSDRVKFFSKGVTIKELIEKPDSFEIIRALSSIGEDATLDQLTSHLDNPSKIADQLQELKAINIVKSLNLPFGIKYRFVDPVFRSLPKLVDDGLMQ